MGGKYRVAHKAKPSEIWYMDNCEFDEAEPETGDSRLHFQYLYLMSECMFHELTIKKIADSQSEVDAAGTDWFVPSVPCRFDMITIWLG